MIQQITDLQFLCLNISRQGLPDFHSYTCLAFIHRLHNDTVT